MDIIEAYKLALREEQIEMETEVVRGGYSNYLASCDSGKEEFNKSHVQGFITRLVEPFREEIDRNLAELKEIKRGTTNPLYKATEFMGPRKMAYLTTYTLIGSLYSGRKMNAVASGMSKAIIENMIADVHTNKKLDSSEKEALIIRIKKMDKVGFILVDLFYNLFSEFYSYEITSEEDQTKEFIRSVRSDYEPKYFTISTRPITKSKSRVESIVEASDSMRELMESSSEAMALQSFSLEPMISEPDSWDYSGTGGGYYSPMLKMDRKYHFKRNLVKTHAFKGVDDKNTSLTSYDVVGAVNAIQSTPWRVNTFILDVLLKLEDNEEARATLKKVYPAETKYIKRLDNQYTPEEFKALSKEKKKELRDNRSAITRANDLYKAKQSIDRDRTISIEQAVKFKDRERIYFPYDLDYRGRIYAMAMSGLNPQGSDLAKGLIQFAEGSPVRSADGDRWFKINMANLMGKDKLRLDERVAFTEGSEELLRSVISDPIKNTDWHDWDKPLQGLACAYDYVNYLDDPSYKVLCHIQLDGKCNGVQHLCALTNDDKVAPHVGLVETYEGGDIYQFVCDAVMKVVEQFKETGNETEQLWATQWLDSELINRSLTKKPVMTRSYAATLYGIKDGVKDHVLKEGKETLFNELILESNWMGQIIWDTMNEELKGPMLVMEYFKKVAKVVGEANKPLWWTTPSGMRCYYGPRKTKTKNLQININRRTKNYTLNTPTDDINKAKLQSSIAPNIIHSFDASHLIMTTIQAMSKGIQDFAYVHDSFGVKPDQVTPLLESIRRAWIDIYSTNQLERLYEEWVEMYPECDIPDWKMYVETGSLDAREVLKSDFFFG